MNSDDFADLIFFSNIELNPENDAVNFIAYKGKETVIADLIKNNHLENISMDDFNNLVAKYMPLVQAKQKLQEKKIDDFKNMSPEKISRLTLEQKIEYLETIFNKYQTNEKLADIYSLNKDNLKALLYGIRLPKDFWQSEERQADRFVSLVSDNQQITDNMKNWQKINLEDKKATIKTTAKIIEYVYGIPLEIGFYTSEEYRKHHNLDENAHTLGAYQEKGKIFFNSDRLENSDNYMGVSVVFHEFTHKRQEETKFDNPLINRLFACNAYNIMGMKNIVSSSSEYGDMYSLMPLEIHAFAMQQYVENKIADKTGIEKTKANESKNIRQVHDKAFAMAAVAKYHSI